MKALKITLITIFFLSTTILSKANNSDKISKMTRDVVIEPTKSGAVVSLDMFFKDPDNIAEITIERGSILGESFRQVKSISLSELQAMIDGKLTIIDKYPLAGTEGAYYRAVVVDKEGVMRFYPASEILGTSTASAQ